MKHTPKSWLWPDHTIGKAESRTLREEHNALVNSHAEMLEALRDLKNGIEAYATNPDSKELGERKLNAAYDKSRAILRAIEEG